MAVDEALLREAAEGGPASLRLYEWSEPTLSLGYFQRYEDRRQHPASLNCAVVRRQSGGGAILHDRELTYSIALPAKHPLARNADELYCIVHHVFVDLLRASFDEVAAGWSLAIRERGLLRPKSDEPFLCFQRSARGDVLLTNVARLTAGGKNEKMPAAKEMKILGSAQRRLRGAILQHGSLLLERSPAALELPGFQDLTGTRLSIGSFAGELSNCLANRLGVSMHQGQLSDKLRQTATAILRQKDDLPAWTMRR